MIKIDLITGFLGSGKTTFLKQYAKYLIDQGLNIGILEYDYGAVNVDMLLLENLRGEKCELEMLSAACDADCLHRRFRTKLISMAMSGYDRVIVEPSGIFDMDEFFDLIREEPLDRWYEPGSVIAVVNARLEEKMTKEENFLLASQIADAGCILLSRVQQATSEELASTKAHLQSALKQIGCTRSLGENSYIQKDWSLLDDADYRRLMRCEYCLYDYVKLYTGTEDTSFSSVYFLDQPFSLEKLEKLLPDLFENSEFGSIFRVKGFLQDGNSWFQINATRNEKTVESMDHAQNVLIVIGTNLQQEKIQSYLKTACQ